MQTQTNTLSSLVWHFGFVASSVHGSQWTLLLVSPFSSLLKIHYYYSLHLMMQPHQLKWTHLCTYHSAGREEEEDNSFRVIMIMPEDGSVQWTSTTPLLTHFDLICASLSTTTTTTNHQWPRMLLMMLMMIMWRADNAQQHVHCAMDALHRAHRQHLRQLIVCSTGCDAEVCESKCCKLPLTALFRSCSTLLSSPLTL